MIGFAALGPLEYSGIALAGILLTALFLFFLLREEKSIQAKDGTRFPSEQACQAYEAICERVNTLYVEDKKRPSNALILGLGPEFLKLLKRDGFSDVKTLIKYREDFRNLSQILNNDAAKEN